MKVIEMMGESSLFDSDDDLNAFVQQMESQGFSVAVSEYGDDDSDENGDIDNGE